jgi:hypothetical protein
MSICNCTGISAVLSTRTGQDVVKCATFVQLILFIENCACHSYHNEMREKLYESWARVVDFTKGNILF